MEVIEIEDSEEEVEELKPTDVSHVSDSEDGDEPILKGGREAWEAGKVGGACGTAQDADLVSSSQTERSASQLSSAATCSQPETGGGVGGEAQEADLGEDVGESKGGRRETEEDIEQEQRDDPRKRERAEPEDLSCDLKAGGRKGGGGKKPRVSEEEKEEKKRKKEEERKAVREQKAQAKEREKERKRKEKEEKQLTSGKKTLEHVTVLLDSLLLLPSSSSAPSAPSSSSSSSSSFDRAAPAILEALRTTYTPERVTVAQRSVPYSIRWRRVVFRESSDASQTCEATEEDGGVTILYYTPQRLVQAVRNHTISEEVTRALRTLSQEAERERERKREGGGRGGREGGREKSQVVVLVVGLDLYLRG